MRLIINVYDIQKTCNSKGADVVGLGIYHTGVEILGTEYAFGGNALSNASGVFPMVPRQHSTFEFKQAIDLGEIPVEQFFKNTKRCRRASTSQYSSINFNRDIQPILDELSDEFRANTYDLLLRNCNHFSDALIKRVYAKKKRLPGWINRAAYLGSYFHCLVPSKYTQVIPPGQEEEAAALAAQWKLESDQKKGKAPWQGKGMTLSELSTGETESDTSRQQLNSSFFDSFYGTLAGTRCQSTQPSSVKSANSKSADLSMSRLETEAHGGDDPLSEEDDREEAKISCGDNSDTDTDGGERANLMHSNKSVLNALKNRKQVQKINVVSIDSGSPQSKNKGISGAFFNMVNPRGYYRAISQKMTGSDSAN